LNFFCLVFIVITIPGIIGIINRKKWGRILIILSEIVTILFGIFLIYALFAILQEGDTHGVGEFIIPIIMTIILIVPSIFSVIYLNKPHVKEYFRNKPVQT
jgi:hypothetical protein